MKALSSIRRHLFLALAVGFVLVGVIGGWAGTSEFAGAVIAQGQEEISGLIAQIESKDKQIDWIKQELLGVRELWEKKLVQFNRVTTLEREQARLDGERGQLVAATAQAKGKISEIKIQILQIDQDMRTEVGKDLAEVRGK